MKKQYKSLFSIIMVIMALILTTSAVVSYADTPIGIEAATSTPDTTKTMYYLNIPLKNVEVNLFHSDFKPDSIFPSSQTKNMVNALNNKKHTFIFTYNEIFAGGFPLLTTWNVKVKAEYIAQFLGYSIKLTFLEDININIRSSYYDYFVNGSFNDVTITLLYQGKGYIIGNSSCNGYWYGGLSNVNKTHSLLSVTTNIREVPEDYNELESEGQIGDNGGLVADPVKPSQDSESGSGIFLFDLYNFIVKTFDLEISYLSFKKAIYILIAAMGLGACGRFFSWVKGK